MRSTKTLLNIAVIAGFFGAAPPAMAGGDVNVYSYRQPELIQPALDAFSRKAGIAVNLLFLDKGMIERMRIEGENSPVDVLLTVDIARLDDLKQAGLTQALADAAVDQAIPEKFRDPDRQWFGLTMEPRAIYAARDRVRQEAFTYEELADPKWKGRLCLRDGQHSSNLGLFADMIATHGAADVGKWLTGVKANLARRPSGSDLNQAQAIAEGQCDIALGNTTVIATMLADDSPPEEKKWAGAIRVILPTAGDRGSYVNISGMALARYAPNRDNAVKLMQFLASKDAQETYAGDTLDYPIAAGAEPADILKRFGVLKPDPVPMSDILKYRQQASELVDKAGFNDGPGE
ncbi:MAG: fbpA [Rhizobium sp.]|nr:fbpA [Rhizobium sp.]